MSLTKKIITLISIFVFLRQTQAQNTHKDSVVTLYIDLLSYYIDSLKIEEKDYVISQALLETGWFKCKNCAWSKGYNAFGFRGKNGYLKYNSFLESVIAYSKWQNKKYIPYKKTHPNKNYLDFLEFCGYAETKHYRNRITQINKRLKKIHLK